MNKNEFKQLMDAYLQGTASSQERELLRRWYNSFGESASNVPGLENEAQTEALQEELHQRIRQAVQTEGKKRGKVRRLPVLGWAVAAILFTIAFGAMFWLSMQTPSRHKSKQAAIEKPTYHQVKTGIKQIKKLVLPDGTNLYVNANSTIRIREPLERHHREVFLDEGEAYFEVARDSLRPFIVRTSAVKVEVLGTAFNVKSYSRLEDVTIAVQQGRVRVSDSKRVLDELRANNSLSYRKIDGRIHHMHLKGDQANTWIKGVVPLQKATFKELAVVLYNLYGIRLESVDQKIAQYHRYNLTIHADRPLEETMAIVCSIHKTKYRRKGHVVTIYR